MQRERQESQTRARFERLHFTQDMLQVELAKLPPAMDMRPHLVSQVQSRLVLDAKMYPFDGVPPLMQHRMHLMSTRESMLTLQKVTKARKSLGLAQLGETALDSSSEPTRDQFGLEQDLPKWLQRQN